MKLFIVSYEACDESSMAGGNWDKISDTFSDKKRAIRFAKNLPKSFRPITITKEEVIKIIE